MSTALEKSEYAVPGSSNYASAVAPLSSLASAMLFGSIIFVTASLAARSYLTGDNRTFDSAILGGFGGSGARDTTRNRKSALPLDTSSFLSLYTLLYQFTVLGLILFFAYICEHHPPYPHAQRAYDRDHFIFLVATMFIFSYYTIQKNERESSSLLTKNGDATNNKKGTLGDRLHSIAEGGSSSIPNTDTNPSGNNKDYQRSSRHGDDTTYTSFTTATTMGGTFVQAADTAPCNDVLNRAQTDEWKGWMQLIFLLYHYYHATEIYNAIRVMITCYVWLTGFGNFTFFYTQRDYSLVRVLQMIFRLNFLVVFLSMSQGTTYILYYICPLHTYFFMVVYLTMRVSRHLNYSKFGLRFKMAVLALITYLIWDVDLGIFRMMHFAFLNKRPTLGAPNGELWEWYFRTALDHWSTFLGMIFAADLPIVSLFYRKLEALPWYRCWLGKGSVGVVLLAALGMWASGPFQQEKVVYNFSHPFFGFIPLVTYVYFRNITPSLRSHGVKLLQEIGKTTLETYLMQHHIWLTSDAKTLLTVIPGYPKVNALVVTLVYFYTSRKLYGLTLSLKTMLLPNNDLKSCRRSMVALVAIVLLFQGLAFFLDSIGFSSLRTVGFVSILCGLLLYQTIMDTTWQSYHDSSETNEKKERYNDKENNDDESSILLEMMGNRQLEKDSLVARISPPIIGAMVVLIIGLFWQGMAVSGAVAVGPLSPSCDVYANEGRWVAVDGCDGETSGAAYRNHGVTNFATCREGGGAQTWGWNKASYPHCRFTRRSPKDLEKALRHRRVVFVGDSMTRNLYYAVCRQLGMADAGQYDATGPRHADFYNTIGDTSVDFRWAPLAVDQVMAMKELSKLSREEDLSKYDFVAIGGGAWDRLHMFATDEDQESHRVTLGFLKQEMDSLRSFDTSVVWVTPTTINTPALNTEEKRDHMTEEDMADMRKIYADLGILSSASFVLEGPAFTKDRVGDSFDGVHYPHDVYDAGAQIIANSFDWLLPKRNADEPIKPLEPGTMSNPFLGLMMLCFCFIGLMFFDGFLGFSYVACIFIKGILPSDLYTEAFTILHDKMKLPPIVASSSATAASFFTVTTNKTTAHSINSRAHSRGSGSTSVDDEISALLGESSGEVELKATR